MKTTKRENKSGTVRYLHLAHNEWDPAKGRAVPKVPFTFGREDQLDRDAVKRLVVSLSRLLEPGDALAATAACDLEFTSSVLPIAPGARRRQGCGRLPICAMKATGSPSNPWIISRNSHPPEPPLTNSATVVAVESATPPKSSASSSV